MARQITYSDDEVRRMMCRVIPDRGMRSWCSSNGVNASHAIEFKNGKRNVPSDLLAALGLEYKIVRRPRP